MARSSPEAVCNKRLSIAIMSVLSTVGMSGNPIAFCHDSCAVFQDCFDAAFNAGNSVAATANLTFVSASSLRAIRVVVLSHERF